MGSIVIGKIVNYLAMAKGLDRYFFRWDDEPESLVMLYNTFDKFAENPDLNFDYADASLLRQKAREAHNKPVKPVGDILS